MTNEENTQNPAQEQPVEKTETPSPFADHPPTQMEPQLPSGEFMKAPATEPSPVRPQPLPTVGRIVHYGFSAGVQPMSVEAALIVRVNANGTVALTRFAATGGVEYVDGVHYSPDLIIGYWTFPPRA